MSCINLIVGFNTTVYINTYLIKEGLWHTQVKR